MSYDLYFSKPCISQEQFREYFSQRPHYEVSDSQVSYQNEDTGVYFLIDYNEAEEEDPDVISSTASLSLNYYRPHVFGLEAADEIQSLIEHFGFSIHDPQNQGMGDEPFTKEGFLRAWNHGNEFGYSAILRGENAPQRLFTFPTNGLESIWRWNLQKTSIQKSLTEDIFVPRIFFMEIAGQVVSAAVWPDAISELIPSVDYLIIGRDELAPKPFFGNRKKDQIIVPMSEFTELLQGYATTDYALPSYKLPSPRVPDSIRERIRKLKTTGITAEGISSDQVLNEEIVNKTKQG